ncbi:unnamed protein product [Porites lobata]|uniref:Uncharacterized protein n=1 Tax=Porites lobata TaxID=104759 RepID=A0ABN8S105_9CNID|nr:unnamed protein product [Porites lobata]
MVCSRFLFVLLAGVVCSFCGKDFVSLGRHACRVVLGLNDQLRADLNDAVLTDQESGDVSDPLTASGVPSPQPEDHCFPDEYFKSILSLNPPITVQNLSSRFKLLNDTVYDYFSANFGQVARAPDESLIRKYEGKSKNDLKKSLKVLKQFANADITEIKYVSGLLRDILRDNTSCQVNADLMNHDYSISKN